MADIGVVIVNYRARDLLRDCLVSLLNGGGPSLDVVVVDNHSEDGSNEMLHAEFPSVTLMALDENVGYGPANNVGVRALLDGESGHERPKHVLLLNPDTLLPAGAVDILAGYMDSNPQVGAVGPRLVRPDGSLDRACRRGFPSPGVAFYHFLYLDRVFPRSPRFARYNMSYLSESAMAEVDSLVGAFMLIRREALEQSGLFDEAFFMYGEDLDLCFRIKQRGWKVVYNPAATIVHHKGASSKQNSAKANYEFYRAMLLFHRKHYADTTFFAVNWLIVGAILAQGGIAQLRNALSPRVGSA